MIYQDKNLKSFSDNFFVPFSDDAKKTENEPHRVPYCHMLEYKWLVENHGFKKNKIANILVYCLTSNGDMILFL